MNERSRTEYSILNIVTGLGGYALNTVLGLVCRMVFTRTLAADYLGINGLFSNILSMLSLAELGIGTAIVYALYKPLAEHDEEKIASLVQYYGKCYRIIGIVVAVLGVIIAPFLKFIITNQPEISESLYLIYSIYLFNTASTYFFSYRGSLITAAQQHYIVLGVNYLVTITQSIIQIVWLIVTHNYIGYLVIISVGTFVNNILISYIAKRKFPYITKKDVPTLTLSERKSLIKNVRALTIWKISGLLVNSTDNIIITYFKGLTTVGLASNYTLLSGTIKSLLNQVFGSLGASIGNLNAIESKEKRISMFYTINFANFWMFGWAAIGIFVVSSDIIRLLFGDKYVLPLNISFVIALNFYMVGIQSAVWSFQNAMGLFRQGRYLLFLTAAINLFASIKLGEKWGLFGILIATAISRLLTNTWFDPYKVFRYGFGESVIPYFRRRLFYLGLLVAIGMACYYLSNLSAVTAHTDNLVAVIAYKCFICILIPNAVFYLTFRRRKEFLYYADLFRKLIKKRRR